MHAIWQDVRYGLRMLAKNRGFTVVAVLTLALGIGANSAIFSVIDAALLRPLPYPNPNQVVALYLRTSDGQTDNPAPADFLDFRKQSASFAYLAAFRGLPFNLSGQDHPERVEGAVVTPDFFPVLGVHALLGRTISPEIDQPGGPSVVVLSYSLWQRRYAGAPSISGKSIVVDGEPRTVVGVMPKNFAYPGETALWISSRFAAPPHPLKPLEDPTTVRDSHYFETIARLKPGVAPSQAIADVDTIAKHLKQQYGNDEGGEGATVISLRQDLIGETRPALLILLGAVSLVLLIACVNVTNLILARGAARQKEIALRGALGAGRLRLVRQLLIESLLLAAWGGGLGMLLAYWAMQPLRELVPTDMVGGAPITVDLRVLGFTALASLVSGILFGLIPGLRLSNLGLNSIMKDGTRGSGVGGRAQNTRRVLVVSEIALAAVLLIGAGLLLRSFSHLLAVPEGFNAENVLSLQMSLSQARYPQPNDRVGFVKAALARASSLPGVASAAAVSRLPLNPGNSTRSLEIEGRSPSSVDISPDYLVISPDYFQTMGIPLLSGRTFTDRDDAKSAPVVIITQATARHFWPGEDALGKHLRVGVCGDGDSWCEVVGVVGDIRQHHLEAPPKLAVYVPYARDPWTFLALVARTKTEPASAGSALVGAIHQIDPEEPVYNLRTMREVESASLSPQRLQLVLLGLFAVLALALACMGIYGVMAYFVAQRTNEIGVRMALGAQPRNVLGMVVHEGMRLALLGAALGAAGSFFLTRLLSGLLFGVKPADPVTFAGVVVLLMLVALLACYIPARQATRVDPIVALRYE